MFLLCRVRSFLSHRLHDRWFTTFVGVFMGTVGVKILGAGATPANPFSAVLEEVMNLGGFAKVAGVVAVTASLAAIMSTADSLIIAVSQLITMEVLRPNLTNSSPERLTMLARLVSLGSVVVALMIGLLWDEGITALGRIQFPLSTQAVPAFLYGLFCYNRQTDVHPWSVAAGAMASSVFVFAFFFGYLNVADSPRPVNAGISGFCINIAVTVGAEVVRRQFKSNNDKEYETETTEILFPDRPSWDMPNLSRFGEKSLTPQRIWKMMEGVAEPLTSPTWVAFFFFVISLTTPLTPENEPPLVDGVFGDFMPALIGGLPWWYMKLLMISAVSTLILLVSIARMPHKFPETKDDKEKEVYDSVGVEEPRTEAGAKEEEVADQLREVHA